MTLRLDWETRSDIDLTKAGVYRYVESPYTDALLASYKIGDGPLRRWTRGQPCPADIRAHVKAGGEIIAHNAAFERLIWWHVMSARHGWPKPRIEQFRCTAVAAAAMSLPRSLDRLGAALDVTTKKDKIGSKLIKAHSMPAGRDADGSPIWNEDPDGLARFHDYCDIDVLAEEECESRLIPLSDDEQSVYHLNELINDRGIGLDVKSARAAVALAEKAKLKLDGEMCELTGGYVPACTNVAALVRWCGQQGYPLPSGAKDDLDEVLAAEDIPERVRRALELRQEAAKTSVSKLTAMLDRVSADGRIRGVYLHQGAGQTGRFSSRGVQAHNMPKYRKDFETALENGMRLDVLFDIIRTGEPDALVMCYGEQLGRPLHLLSDAIRSFLWAAPGRELIDADYSSIEGRMAAWFAGEEWKLDAFRQLDAGTGHGIYELTAAGIYGIPVESVTKFHRPVGKVAELSCQYQTGVGGIRKFARPAKIKLHTLYPALWEAMALEQREQAEKRFADRVQAHDPHTAELGREGWIAAELIKVGWRQKHPGIVETWATLEDMANQAVQNPGQVVGSNVLPVRYIVRHGFLWCQLPSGRCLAYGAPRIEEVEAPWADKTQPAEKREKKQSVTVMGVDSQTEKWTRYSIYGGSLFNNVVQGSAADILRQGMKNAEAAGYPIVLHTHDEICAEVPRGFGDVKEFERIISVLPAWANGLPLTADGWRDVRYHK